MADSIAQIERVTDSHGNGYGGERPGELNRVITNMQLYVGDVLAYSCRGIDPLGRPLIWTVGIQGQSEPLSAFGDDVEIVWTVTKKSVGRHVLVTIRLLAEDAEFHRYTYYDEQLKFIYEVLPPH